MTESWSRSVSLLKYQIIWPFLARLVQTVKKKKKSKRNLSYKLVKWSIYFTVKCYYSRIFPDYFTEGGNLLVEILKAKSGYRTITTRSSAFNRPLELHGTKTIFFLFFKQSLMVARWQVLLCLFWRMVKCELLAVAMCACVCACVCMRVRVCACVGFFFCALAFVIFKCWL